jgi:hypothetical protein
MHDKKLATTRKYNQNKTQTNEFSKSDRIVDNSEERQEEDQEIIDDSNKSNHQNYNNETSEYSNYKYHANNKHNKPFRYRNFKYVDQYYQNFDFNNPYYFQAVQNGLNSSTHNKHLYNSYQTYYYNNNSRYHQSYSSTYKKDRNVSTRQEYSFPFGINQSKSDKSYLVNSNIHTKIFNYRYNYL